ncbi:B- and T-lymphocyte attenuator-like [Coregonus clupeaformis]|uniref:B- and T-lymphocyte attenuator-like n=1 Tax=Coregonus clupeaformis TaxID=59861 RepID=UPI001BDF930D|nr:B- and T-lymphocyte attenuator-like [Coregonus clupeaformis]
MDPPCSDHILLVLCLLFLVCIHGNAQGPCEIEVPIKRNTVWNAVPQKRLTINCPVKHCGETLRVTWCKFEDANCKQIHETEQVKIGWKPFDRWSEDRIAFLDFKNISINDNGSYRCGMAGHKSSIISHAINVSVSDSNLKMTSTTDHNTNDSPNAKLDEKYLSWKPYVYICVGIVLLVVMVTAISFLCLYGCKGSTRSTNNRIMEQAEPCPDLSSCSKGTFPSSPSTPNPAQSNNFYNNGPYGKSLNRESPHSLLVTNGALPSSDLTAGGQGSNYLVYAALNHQTPRGSPKPPHIPTPQDECSEYAAIRVY